MTLYAATPIITTSEGGTINIKVLPITSEYIDARLAELAIPAEFNYDVREYEALIQCASSHKDAVERLKWRFGFGAQEAEFLLSLTIEEKKVYFIQENCETEIRRWKTLKEILL
jgi:hypothetical protein